MYTLLQELLHSLPDDKIYAPLYKNILL